MSLIDIKKHMMMVRMATLGGLCVAFKADPDTIRCMLRHWMQKGKVRKCLREPACGTKCFKCPAETTEIYEWIDVSSGLAGGSICDVKVSVS